MKKFKLWMAVLIISSTSIAFANHHEEGDAQNYEIVEPMAKGDFSIAYLDANKDGVITQKEYLDGDNMHTEEKFQHMDANGDGVLDAFEQQKIEAVYQEMHEQYKAKTKSI